MDEIHYLAGIFHENSVNTVVADAIVLWAARLPTAVVLTVWTRNWRSVKFEIVIPKQNEFMIRKPWHLQMGVGWRYK